MHASQGSALVIKRCTALYQPRIQAVHFKVLRAERSREESARVHQRFRVYDVATPQISFRENHAG